MTRRPPPPFVNASVTAREWLSPRIARVMLGGEGLAQMEISQPASSVRVLLPWPDQPHALQLPSWDGNRFVLEDGRRPPIRTLTPRHHDRTAGTLALDVVVHGDGAASRWASTASPGLPVAVSGPARGYELDPATEELVLGGDETAYGAVCSIVEAAPDRMPVRVFLEGSGSSPPPIPPHPRCQHEWLTATSAPGRVVAERLARVELSGGTRLWAGGEAAAMQQLRQSLFRDRGVPRTSAVVRGYWKHGRASDEDGDAAG